MRNLNLLWTVAVCFSVMLCHSTFASAAYINDVLTLNPLNYWQLNESVSPALDSGSNPTNGTFGAASTPGLAGPRPADGFLGMSSSNNAPGLIDGNTASEVNMGVYTPVTGTSPRTVLAWINNNSLSGVDTIVNFGSGVSPGNRFRLQTSGNQLGIDIQGTGGLVIPSNPSTNLSANTWHMVGVVVPAGASNVGDLTFYVDGIAASIANSAVFSTVAGADFILGREPGNGALNFDGRIDEVAVFDYALSTAQIQSLFLSAQTEPAPIPEPSSLFLLGLGLVGLVRRKRGHQ